jgi:hypothetical protein
MEMLDSRYGERIRFRPNRSLLDSLLVRTTGYDADAYLSDATLTWFDQLCEELAITQPKNADFIIDHHLIILSYYGVFLKRAR